MSNQESLFNQPVMESPPAKARHTDPETSHAAARLVKVPKLQLLILKALLRGPMNMSEIWEVIDRERDKAAPRIWPDSVSPRFKPLFSNGYVAKTGRLTPSTFSSRNMEEFEITDLGRSVLEPQE